MTKRFQYLVVICSTCLLAVLLLGTVLGRGAAADGDAYKHFSVFGEVVAKIKGEYVEEPNMHNVALGALNGLLESLDPYASYLSADQYKQYQKSIADPQGDVGLLLSRRSGYIGVVDALAGSPADKAGITTFDIVEAINGISTRDMPLAYAGVLLKGAPGSSVELSVIRVRRGAEAQKVSLTRERLTPAPVAAGMLAGDIGHLRIPSLVQGKAAEAAARLADLQKQGARKLVLDLRDNGGGPPEEGIALARLFLEQGLVGYLQGQKVPKEEFRAEPSKVVWKQPVVVLVNRGTAGGSEVAAAALLENKRAEVVGERTYGEAALRKALTLDDGSAVILAVAKYHAPGGKAIQDTGVTPTLSISEPEPAIDPDDETQAPPAPEPPKPSKDVQLEKAVEVLTKGLEEAKKASAPASAGRSGPEPAAPQGPLNVPRPPR